MNYFVSSLYKGQVPDMQKLVTFLNFEEMAGYIQLRFPTLPHFPYNLRSYEKKNPSYWDPILTTNSKTRIQYFFSTSTTSPSRNGPSSSNSSASSQVESLSTSIVAQDLDRQYHHDSCLDNGLFYVAGPLELVKDTKPVVAELGQCATSLHIRSPLLSHLRQLHHSTHLVWPQASSGSYILWEFQASAWNPLMVPPAAPKMPKREISKLVVHRTQTELGDQIFIWGEIPFSHHFRPRTSH